MDIICMLCGEPWEHYYLRWDAPFDHPGDRAPAAVLAEHEAVVAGEEPNGAHVAALLKGKGCPSCWSSEPEATLDEAGQLAALEYNVFDSGWDGDPAEILGAL